MIEKDHETESTKAMAMMRIRIQIGGKEIPIINHIQWRQLAAKK